MSDDERVPYLWVMGKQPYSHYTGAAVLGTDKAAYAKAHEVVLRYSKARYTDITITERNEPARQSMRQYRAKEDGGIH